VIDFSIFLRYYYYEQVLFVKYAEKEQRKKMIFMPLRI